MADERTHKSIAERLDLEFHRRGISSRWRRRRWAMLLAAVIPLAWLTVATAAGWHSVYWAEPVSTAHRFLAQDCARCHTATFQPLLRTVTLSEHFRSVTDAACRNCHIQTATDHQAVSSPVVTLRCVTCHREHREMEALSRVANAHCTACHAQLPATPEPPQIVATIASLEGHPEFAVLAAPDLHARRFDVSRLAVGGADVPVVKNASGTAWQDSAQIKFNHAKHLVPAGVLMPWQAEHGAPGDKAVRKVLACADCHEPAGAGQSLKPIAYERHCAKCHVLSFSEKLVPGGPLPHAAPLLVQSTLRERLLAYAKSHPTEHEGAAPAPRLPNKEVVGAPPIDSPAAWVDEELASRTGDVFRTVANGCAQCHTVEPVSDAAVGEFTPRWNIAPTAIPSRWLPWARFRHDKHETVACTSCHAAPQSSHTADILLPSLNVCRQCHASNTLAGGGHARGDCVECHAYHHAAPAPGKPLEELLGP